jgi:hypothetical protein
MTSILETFAGVVFLFLSVLLFINYVHSSIKRKQALSWPHTDGEIIKSELDFSSTESGPNPVIAYRYSVDDIERIGRTVSFSSTTTNPKSEIERYPVEHRVTVYYNPNDPGDCTLELEPVFEKNFFWIASFVIPLVAGIFLLCK